MLTSFKKPTTYKAYITLSRTDCQDPRNNNSKFTWDITDDNQQRMLPEGTLAVSAKLHNVTEMRILPFRFPTPTTTINDTFMTLLFDELVEQSFSINDRHYHFMFDTETGYTERFVKNTFKINNTFHFNNPVREITKLSLSLAFPTTVVTFPVVEVACDTGTVSGATLSVTRLTAHGLTVGDLVRVFEYLDNAQPAGPFVDPEPDKTIVTEVNRSLGHNVTVVTSPTQFTISLSFGMTASRPIYDFYIQILTHSFNIPVEFTCLDVA